MALLSFGGRGLGRAVRRGESGGCLVEGQPRAAVQRDLRRLGAEGSPRLGQDNVGLAPRQRVKAGSLQDKAEELRCILECPFLGLQLCPVGKDFQRCRTLSEDHRLSQRQREARRGFPSLALQAGQPPQFQERPRVIGPRCQAFLTASPCQRQVSLA